MNSTQPINSVSGSAQEAQSEWTEQWARFAGDPFQTEALFWEWVAPLVPEDFRGRRVLDAGCGGGHMLGYLRRLIRAGVGLDLNTAPIARRRFRDAPHIRIEQGDIARWAGEKDFDIVYSIGVIHHTKNPADTVRNLMTLVRPGGKFAFWVYGHEGNFWVRTLVEKPKVLYRWMPRGVLWFFSLVLAVLLTPIVYSIYLLPLRFLPYYEYFRSWRRLSFVRNAVNIFDKLNAPTTHFIKRQDIERWFSEASFEDVSITPWCGISWRVCATRARTAVAARPPQPPNSQAA
jgi:SAM-dependent methyltransferase